MKIAVLGGGITGLTAAYYLAKQGYLVTLLEKDDHLGGLASGFKEKNWKWSLERAYHHIFSSDTNIRSFAEEIGYTDIFFSCPSTDSLYNGRILPFDTPQDLLAFPYLSFLEKMRAGFVLGFLKFSPFLPIYEKYTSEELLKKYMGKNVWNGLFQELFRKKFGKYAGNILASFIWTRFNKRSKDLGYMKGGFQSLVDHIEKKNKKLGVIIKTDYTIEKITKEKSGFLVNNEKYDSVISTLPTPVLIKVGKDVLPQNYISKLSHLHYLHAVNLIIESEKPLLDTTYWLSICDKNFPMMVAVQHTNLVGKSHYDNHHLLYVGNYVDSDDKLLTMNKEETLNHFLPYLDKLKPGFSKTILKTHHFKAPWAQPVFDKTFLKSKPDFITPTNGFYIANLDMTYPYDRGTNYAVKLGREVAEIIKHAYTS